MGYSLCICYLKKHLLTVNKCMYSLCTYVCISISTVYICKILILYDCLSGKEIPPDSLRCFLTRFFSKLLWAGLLTAL